MAAESVALGMLICSALRVKLSSSATRINILIASS